ncbi:LysR family transcriptional regulator [Sphingorhabdus sp. IMCC26285]|uniref:LysR family transcriptional regulator n=1 Tax=Sphingorhabdus profundilacus TaxID=2509718 RepID=A0A6I4M2W1_9SPHN|nr:LysR family transcriptional regulator [Sphingorhabdus profundilacus]MVZ98653.1 LysR family transcriptional regulator [Sphingorhabdus profundilacus]
MNEVSIWMRSFVAVANAGSFSAAAGQVGVTQSTISKQIVALERHLGTQLFRRTTRSLALTADGMLFYEGALRALAAIDEAESLVGLVANIQGIVRLTCPLSLAESRMTAMIGRFLTLHPKMEIDLQLSDHALNLVSDNLDLAIRVGQLGDSRLTARKIGLARRIIVAAPAYLDRYGRPDTPSDLRHHNCMSYTLLSAGARWQFTSGDVAMVSGNFRTDSPHGLRAAAVAGIGIAANARWLFDDELASGALEIVLPDHELKSMPIHAILPSSRFVSARTRALLDHLVREFALDPLLSTASYSP